MITAIFMIGLYPVLFIMYYVMKNAGGESNGYCFGVSMKAEWLNDEAVKQCCEEFAKQMKRLFIILAVIPIATFAIPYFSISFSIWMCWMLVVIVVPSIPFVKASRRLKEIKRERGWAGNQQKVTVTEIRNAGEVRRIKLLPFLPPILLSLAAAGWGIYSCAEDELEMMGVLIAVFALTTVLLYIMAAWMDRQKLEVISSDSEVNLNYGRAKKNVWKNTWLACAWVNAAYVAVTAWAMHPKRMRVDLLLWGCMILTVVLLLLMLLAWKRIIRIDKIYADRKDLLPEKDDDDNWIGGILYYNKKDRHVMVNKRVGIGTTVNMATPVGMGLTVFSAVVLLAIPLVCVWLILEEFTPIRLSVQNDALMAEHLRVEYVIPLDEVEDAKLLDADEMPRWSKVNGTGMDNLCKGTFHIRNEGNCEVFLNPQNHAFICFDADGVTYYMSGTNDEDTLDIFEQMETAL